VLGGRAEINLTGAHLFWRRAPKTRWPSSTHGLAVWWQELELPRDAVDWTLAHHWIDAGAKDRKGKLGKVVQVGRLVPACIYVSVRRVQLDSCPAWLEVAARCRNVHTHANVQVGRRKLDNGKSELSFRVKYQSAEGVVELGADGGRTPRLLVRDAPAATGSLCDCSVIAR
jgi:hypothetical protein